MLITQAPDARATAWNTVARYNDYEQAQAAVDRLSDDGFPVERLTIVGSDLRLVEKLTGRMTTRRAAGSGALGGAWFGLLVGFLLGLFSTGAAWVWLITLGVGSGALWGAVFGFLAHRATRGRRDFSATRALAAAHYDVVAVGEADRARVMLGQAGLLPRDAVTAFYGPV